MRLRPILMTTVMLVAAMIPIALGQGSGAGARASTAKVIIRSQMLSLLLALLVTPVTYSLFDGLAQFLGRVRGTGGRKEATDPEPREAISSPDDPLELGLAPTLRVEASPTKNAT